MEIQIELDLSNYKNENAQKTVEDWVEFIEKVQKEHSFVDCTLLEIKG